MLGQITKLNFAVDEVLAVLRAMNEKLGKLLLKP
jgi:hypothetical protein